MGEEASFYFRGPKNEMNLRAHNLTMFLQIAEGIDDATWEAPSAPRRLLEVVRGTIGDEELAEEAAGIEEDRSLSPAESPAEAGRGGAPALQTAPASEAVEPAPAAGVEETSLYFFGFCFEAALRPSELFERSSNRSAPFSKVRSLLCFGLFLFLGGAFVQAGAGLLAFAVGACSVPMAAIPPCGRTQIETCPIFFCSPADEGSCGLP